MFGTLLGGLPRPAVGDAASAVETVLRAQENAGLEPVTDGRLAAPGVVAARADAWTHWSEPITVPGWLATAAMTDRAVKQVLPGPYSLARAAARRQRDLAPLATAIAEGLRQEALALATAGCPIVEIEETEAHRIGENAPHRAAFRAAHRRLADGIADTHLSLSIVGGSAWEAGAATILDAAYRSLAVDLIAGPDNWRLVAVTPGDRGIVAGALSPQLRSDDAPELLVYAANYAASTGGRGRDRVGLAIAGSLAHLSWDDALRKLDRFAHGLRLATLPPGEELANAMDPRAINIRSAAHGRPMPIRPPRGHGRPGER